MVPLDDFKHHVTMAHTRGYKGDGSGTDENGKGDESGNKGGSGTISEVDRAKIDSWKYTPSDELYLKYKEVFDNPKYYNQTTGEINWPANDGFLSSSK